MDSNEIRREGLRLLFTAAAMMIAFKAIFYSESIAVTTRTALSLFWMFTLPGYAMLSYWKEKLDFLERIVVGTAAAAGATAILSYYIGLFGVHAKYHAIILPALMILAGLAASKKASSAQKEQEAAQ